MKILLSGASGFIGKNILESLKGRYDIVHPSHQELDLTDADRTKRFVRENSIDTIIHSANIGGTRATSNSADIINPNLRMYFNIARLSNEVDRVIYFGSGAEYGKHCSLKKIPEENFDLEVPKDPYGFYKYICSQHCESSENIYNLRLFGVFGKYEDYRVKIISNSILKSLLGLDITIVQDVVFDFIYIDDLIRILPLFIDKKPKFHTYNITPTESISLTQIAEIISSLNPERTKIKILNKGMNNEYTGSNKRLLSQFPECNFTAYGDSIKSLHTYYEKNLSRIDKKSIIEDKFMSKCDIKK